MRILLLIMLSGFSALGYADSVLPEMPKTLQPADTTLAMFMLYRVFGSIGGLHGTGSQIVSEMFRVFNSVILTFAGFLCTYTTFFGIANTTHEGEILGKKWSSIWIPVRTVGGSLLLAPQASGYSMIQVLVMTIVIQGVGAADRLWESALHYLDRYGTIVESMSPIKSDGTGVDNGFLIDRSGNVLKITTCMSMLNRALQIHYNTPNSTYFSMPTPVLYEKPNTRLVTGGSIAFPGKPFFKKNGLDLSVYEGACGTMRWDFKEPKSADSAQYMTTAVQGMILSMSSLSWNIVNEHLFPVRDRPGYMPNKSLDDFLLEGSLLHAAYDFFAIMKPQLRAESLTKEYKDAIKEFKQGFIVEAAHLGFAGAASWHSRLLKLNTALRTVGEHYALSPDALQVKFSPNYQNTNLFPFATDIMDRFRNILPIGQGGPIDQYIQRENSIQGANDHAQKFFPKQSPGKIEESNVFDQIGYVLTPFSDNINAFQKNMERELGRKQDPIVALANIGHFLIDAVLSTWMAIIAGTALLMGVLTALSIPIGMMGVGIPAAINGVLGVLSLLGLFIPLLATWMAVNLSVGAILAYYVPLIPYILFFFGVLHWLAFVVEAIIAGPLIALGIMYPEGHDIMGKSEQAALLLTSVFLWPMLMVFGFILGIIVCTVAFELFCYTYTLAIDAIKVDTGVFGKMVYMTAQVSFMGAFLVRMITSSYSLIYEVRNKALRWIGGPIEHLTEAEALNRVESATSKQSEHMGQAGSSKALESISMISPSIKAGLKLGEDKKAGQGNPNIGVHDGGNQQAPQDGEG